MSYIQQTDPEIAALIEKEIGRQEDGLEMIASENHASLAVISAMGTPLTNKYSEGYYSKRYYGGNEYIDEIEKIAIERAKQIFGAEHANVQPHAGSQANQAAYFAMVEPGDTILALDLGHGGHLTHGASVNFSGKIYHFVHYGVSKDTERIDMDEVRRIALKEKPKLIVSGFTAYSRHLDFAAFRAIADEIGAYHMTDMAHFAGLVAAKVHPDPIPFADVVTTTTHKTLRGPRGGMILSRIERQGFSAEFLGQVPEKRKTLAQKIDSAVFPGLQGGPLDHVIAAKAVAFKEALTPEFVTYQKQTLVNCKALGETLSENGIRLVTGGTDNHLLLLDLTSTGLSGKQAEKLLDSVHIYTNKNMIPFDTRTPFDPSGLRIGTAALTTRGVTESEMREVGTWISEVLKNPEDTGTLERIKANVAALAAAHPLYPHFTLA